MLTNHLFQAIPMIIRNNEEHLADMQSKLAVKLLQRGVIHLEFRGGFYKLFVGELLNYWFWLVTY